jgi:hypothetical protein
MCGPHTEEDTEEDDVRDMIAHIGDRAATSIHEWNQASSTLAFQRRVIPPDALCSVPLGVTFIQLKVVLSCHILAKGLSLIPVHAINPKGARHLPKT